MAALSCSAPVYGKVAFDLWLQQHTSLRAHVVNSPRLINDEAFRP